MYRALASTALRVYFRRHADISASRHAKFFHNVRLVELHDRLNQFQEPTLKFHGIIDHLQKYPQGPLYESAFQRLQSCKKTGAQTVKTGPVYVQYGPLFEKAKQNPLAVTDVATAAGNTVSETKPGEAIKVAKRVLQGASKSPTL